LAALEETDWKTRWQKNGGKKMRRVNPHFSAPHLFASSCVLVPVFCSFVLSLRGAAAGGARVFFEADATDDTGAFPVIAIDIRTLGCYAVALEDRGRWPAHHS
jgi:hypothetical protein